MRIGIDVDGVIQDVYKYQSEEGSKYFNKKMINPKKYEMCQMFNISVIKELLFWQEKIIDYSKNAPLIKNSKEIIDDLKNEGHDIYIVTARGYNAGNYKMKKLEMKNLLINWLKENKIYYDKIIYTGHNKVRECKKYKIDILIEDKPKNIKQISKYIPVIIFDNPYNTDLKIKNTYKAKKWNEIPNIIKKINR